MTARRRTNKRKSMKGKAQYISKEQLRWPGADVIDFRAIIHYENFGLHFQIRSDKNGQLCDFQPRIGNIHSTLQGRPVDLISNEELFNTIKAELLKLNDAQLESLLAQYPASIRQK